jgi:hypothetical protein
MKSSAVMYTLALCAALPLLGGCENSATSMLVDGKDHSLVLVREQPYFWSGEVRQFMIVSRLPRCQRRVSIHPGSATMTSIDVYEAGDMLWALNQGGRWYLASTESCQVQDWNDPAPGALGAAVGRFERRGDDTVFTALTNQKTPIE